MEPDIGKWQLFAGLSCARVTFHLIVGIICFGIDLSGGNKIENLEVES